MRHQVGDLITRDGSDVHVVEAVIGDSGCVQVRCLTAPVGGWAKVGDVWIGEEYDFEVVDPKETPNPMTDSNEHEHVVAWLMNKRFWAMWALAEIEFELAKAVGDRRFGALTEQDGTDPMNPHQRIRDAASSSP